jgi:hypothetical protein
MHDFDDQFFLLATVPCRVDFFFYYNDVNMLINNYYV